MSLSYTYVNYGLKVNNNNKIVKGTRPTLTENFLILMFKLIDIYFGLLISKTSILPILGKKEHEIIH